MHEQNRWEAVAQAERPLQDQLRLAVIAGQMAVDKVTARRVAIAELLADGRPHPREQIWQQVAEQVGASCWGKRPEETLFRDLAVLRKGGIRIAYSRRPGAEGYYLGYPALKRPSSKQYEADAPLLTRAIKQLSVEEKLARTFAAAEYALRQRKLVLAEQHPDWSEQKVDREARKIVYGAYR